MSQESPNQHADVVSAQTAVRVAEDAFPGDPARQIADLGRLQSQFIESVRRSARQLQLPPGVEEYSEAATDFYIRKTNEAVDEDPAIRILSGKIAELAADIKAEDLERLDQARREEKAASLSQLLKQMESLQRTYADASVSDDGLDAAISSVRQQLDSLKA